MRSTNAATEFTDYVSVRRPMLFRTALMLCGDPHRAEDVVQEALAKLFVAWARVSRMGHVDAYARRAVVTSHYDAARRPWRRERPGPHDVMDAPVRESFDLAEADELWQALLKLPLGQRRVVVLRHYWDLSVEDVARDLGISSGTVKSQTADALKNLRVALAESSASGGI